MIYFPFTTAKIMPTKYSVNVAQIKNKKKKHFFSFLRDLCTVFKEIQNFNIVTIIGFMIKSYCIFIVTGTQMTWKNSNFQSLIVRV